MENPSDIGPGHGPGDRANPWSRLTAALFGLALMGFGTGVAASPITFDLELGGYSVSGDSTFTEASAPNCLPSIPCPPPTPATRSISLTIPKPSKALDLIVIPDIGAVPEAPSNDDILEILFLVFRESIKDTNEDKKYFLMKLQMLNAIGESLADYISDLTEIGQDLARYDAEATFATGYEPSAVAIALYDPETDTAQVAVSDFGQFTIQNLIPEPASGLLFGIGVLGIGALARRRTGRSPMVTNRLT